MPTALIGKRGVVTAAHLLPRRWGGFALYRKSRKLFKMCGKIVGIIQLKNVPQICEPYVIERMCRVLFFRKKETSPAYEFKKGVSPLLQLRQELAQCNALLLYARLGWGGIGNIDGEEVPEYVVFLGASIASYYTAVSAESKSKRVSDAIAYLASATETAAWEQYRHSGVSYKDLKDYITGERIIKAVTSDKELLQDEATLKEALDTIVTIRRSLGDTALPIMATITEGTILWTDVEKHQERITKYLKKEKELTSKRNLTTEEEAKLAQIKEKLLKEAVALQHAKSRYEHNENLQADYKKLVDSKNELLETQEEAILKLQTYLQFKRDEEQLQGVTARLNGIAGGGLNNVNRAADEAKAKLQGWKEIRDNTAENELDKTLTYANAEEYLNELRKNI